MAIFVDRSTHATHPVDGAVEDEMGCAVDRIDPSGEAQEGLSTIRVSDGDGRFLLTVPLIGAAPHVAVDIAPGTLRLCYGRISRYVCLPDDALLDQAVIQHSEDTLTVTIPERERRNCRHIIHVW